MDNSLRRALLGVLSSAAGLALVFQATQLPEAPAKTPERPAIADLTDDSPPEERLALALISTLP